MLTEDQIERVRAIGAGMAERISSVTSTVEATTVTRFKMVTAVAILAGLFADLADGVELNAEQRELLAQVRALGQGEHDEPAH